MILAIKHYKDMKKFIKKIQIWWLFTMRNPIIRTLEKGGFRVIFRRFTMDITTLSGNFKARWIASAHPFGFLVTAKNEDDIYSYASIIYQISMLLTTEQKFADDLIKAVKNYENRLAKSAKVEEDTVDEKAALEFEKKVQAYIELPRKEKKKAERKIDKKFKKVEKIGTEVADGPDGNIIKNI